jgi:predicted XRE-type DNA-binding protein
VIRGSDNIFEDLGFENPGEELAKAKLVRAIAEVIEGRQLTQTRAAELIGLDQPSVSKLLRGRTGGYSIDRLFDILNRLGQDVEIHIRPKPAEVTRAAKVSVAVAHVL